MSLTDEAIAKIKAMIVDGELKPGDRLPPEKELSDRLGLSRNSLREAVKALELVKVLDARRGDGTYVTSLRSDLLMQAMSFAVDLTQHDSILEVLEVRRVLDPTAAAMAAGRASEEHLQQMRRVVDAMDAGGPVEDLVTADIELHRIIADAGQNSYLASLVTAVSGLTFRARVWYGTSAGGTTEQTVRELRAVVNAIAARDTQLARAASLMHVTTVETWLKDAIGHGDTPRLASVEW
ncbi:FadR/GntR family transcriptional regulator [Occultella kanbiaonis]|uniref:FadR/GntR family transcriptional regulator n=1 Tax=Occultella kanbiaonis TaxID=2675754 RepID=UPI0012B85720|nr:FadR/GntR family transcriptional regulator [Occultella kanbiaonis]